MGRFCSLIPGLGVKHSTIILVGPTVLCAVGACPPHDGVRRRWWINVESAVALRTLAKNRTISPIVEHRFINGHVVWTRNDSNTAKILLDTTSLSSE
jgi:hypothetical protein